MHDTSSSRSARTFPRLAERQDELFEPAQSHLNRRDRSTRFNSEGSTLRSVVAAAGSNDRDIPAGAGIQWESRGGYDRVSEALTARERDVLAMISQGRSNKDIARTLKISPETVKSHVKNIFLKLAVGTRAAAVSRAGALGLL